MHTLCTQGLLLSRRAKTGRLVSLWLSRYRAFHCTFEVQPDAWTADSAFISLVEVALFSGCGQVSVCNWGQQLAAGDPSIVQGNVDPSHLLPSPGSAVGPCRASCMLSASCIIAKTASSSMCVCCLLNTVCAGPASQLHQLVRSVHHTTQGVPCHRVGDRGRAFGQVCACIAAFKLKSQCCNRVHVCARVHTNESLLACNHAANPCRELIAVAIRHRLVFLPPLAGVMLRVKLMKNCRFCSLHPITSSRI